MFFSSRRSIVVFITLLTISSIILISTCWYLIFRHSNLGYEGRPYFYELHNISSVEEKLTFIRKMTLEAWKCYTDHAWGYKAVKPMTMKPEGEKNSGRTILSAMSTLWVMGLREEFEASKRWLEKQMDFDSFDLGVHYAVETYLGGLLSCYALTGEMSFLYRAKKIAYTLQPAYQTPTGLSFSSLDVKYKYARGSEVLLSQVAEQQLEYIYLYHLTNDHQIHDRIKNVQKFINRIGNPVEYYLKTVNVENRNWTTEHLLWSQNEMLSVELNLYLQSEGRYMKAIERFKHSYESLEASQLILSEHERYHTREYYHDRFNREDQYRMVMGVSACKLGGVLARGANALIALHDLIPMNETQHSQLWKYAEGLTETCYQAASKTRTGLPPSMWLMNYHYYKAFHDPSTEIKFNSFYLSSQLAESYFVLWRLTQNEKYRHYAWQLAQAIYRNCRSEDCGGYSWVYNVNQIPTEHGNHQPPEFLGATLKFLYLTFTNVSVLPLDQWVFNSAGQPLPISGRSSQYPGEIYTLVNLD